VSGHPLQGWKSACRLFWSFLWRQALFLFAFSGALGALISVLRSARAISSHTVFDVLPVATTTLLVLSCVASFRFLLKRYDIRDPRRTR
jgi:hypothetical protein